MKSSSRNLGILVAGLVVAGLVGLQVTGQGLNSGTGPTEANAATAEAETEPVSERVPVVRQDVGESETVFASASFGTEEPLPIPAEGLVTWAPAQGDVIGAGDIVVTVANRPVVIAAGDTPFYRPIGLGPSKDESGKWQAQMSGPDVAQLQRFLLAAGHDSGGKLTDDGVMAWDTDQAIKAWQTEVGHPPSGTVDRTQMLFLPNDVRVSRAPTVGQPFTEILTTRTAPLLTATAGPNMAKFFVVGAPVILEDAEDVDAVVMKSTRVEDMSGDGRDGGGGQTVLEVEILAGDGFEVEPGASTRVTGTSVIAEDALTVPVRALLALAEGGWAVEVPDGIDSAGAEATKLVGVELVEVAETTAIITGVEEGDEVVVPL